MMAEPAGSELFASYEAELALVRAEVEAQLAQVRERSGEERKAAIRLAERALEEAQELLGQMRIEKQNIPTVQRTSVNQRLRNHESDVDVLKRQFKSLQTDRATLLGSRYRDDDDDAGTDGLDEQQAQRQQLLTGTDRLGRSSQRLRDSQRVALETEAIGRDTLADLHVQRETIQHTRATMLESEGYVDRSVKTLRGMARRMATNRIITIAIITVLVLLILAVIWGKFR